MANFTKAFNFRGGFQVDTDVLVVRGQQVGIGSTVPQQVLDVNGIVRARGLEVSSLDPVAIQSATVGFLSATKIEVGVTSITNGIITATSSAGVVTYYGDGGRLLNLPTSQWLDVDVGLGFTSIYAQGNVGVDTNDPRYVFQVGGIPAPKGNQTGVGIEDGNIFASGNIEAAGDFVIGGEVDITGSVAVAGTVTADQFVGFGSGIQLLNADNLGVGSIPSNRYGDTIITGTVFGDRFAGVADTALSVAIDADLTFDTATGRIIEATEQFLSTNGRLNIGDVTLPPGAGDIVLSKGAEASIYAISTSASSRIFAGRDYDAGSTRSFGGLRFGGNVLADPLSGSTDLDVVNYDEGNLNFYLHAGPGGSTTGVFRWIYGQTDRILADLSPAGKFSLKGNLNSGEPTLEVLGIASITDDVYVGGGISVTANSMFEANVDIVGDLTLSGNIGITTDSLILPSTTFTGEVIVGDEPEVGGGVGLSTDGLFRANRIEVYNGPTTSFSVSQSGGVEAQGIGCTGLDAEFLIQSPTIIGGNYSGNNGFFNTPTGAGFDSLLVSDFSAGIATFTALNVASLSLNSLNVSSTLNINGISLVKDGRDYLGIGASISTPRVQTDQLEVATDVVLTISVGSSSITFSTVDSSQPGPPVQGSVTLPFA